MIFPSRRESNDAETLSDTTVVTRRRLIGIAGAGALAAIATACSNDGPLARSDGGAGLIATTESTIAPTVEPGGPVRVLSNDNTFIPKVVEIAAGGTVEWINGGANEHDILPAEGNPLTDFGIAKDDFPPKSDVVYAYTFTEPGTYDYYCSIHGNMRMLGMVGTVVVS